MSAVRADVAETSSGGRRRLRVSLGRLRQRFWVSRSSRHNSRVRARLARALLHLYSRRLHRSGFHRQQCSVRPASAMVKHNSAAAQVAIQEETTVVATLLTALAVLVSALGGAVLRIRCERARIGSLAIVVLSVVYIVSLHA